MAGQPQDRAAVPGALAVAARALAAAAEDSDDAALLAILGQAVVPSLGDVVALYAADRSGGFRLIGSAPDDAPPVPGFRARAEQQAGLVAEIVAQIGSDAAPDGLLLIGSTDPGRQYDDVGRSAVVALAAIVTIRRAASRQAMRDAKLRQQVESMVLAGRELAHLLNNDLTMPVGVVELLLDRKSASPDLQEMLQAAAHDLAALERHIRAFHDQMREHTSSPDP